MTQRPKQGGFVLVTALIFLVILTLLVVSAIRVGNSELRIAGNTQVKEEALAAAQQATEQIISTNFTTDPTAKTINVDINKDGTTDYIVTVPAQTCTTTKSLLNADLDSNVAADRPCVSSSTAQNTGLMVDGAPAATGQSWCNQQKWEVQAQVADVVTGAAVTTHQGVSMRTVAGTGCP
jgi:Tfp pilus assembly protein PilX